MKWKIFILFLKIGLYSFGGGYAIIPLIEKDIINEYGWITYPIFKEMITISQLTPGPLAVNISTFVGFNLDHYIGALIATSATLIPGLIILILLLNIFNHTDEHLELDLILQSLSLFSFLLITIASINIITLYNSDKTLMLVDYIFISLFLYLSQKKKVSTLTILFFGVIFGLARNFIY